MLSWPTIQPPSFPLEEDFEDPTIRSSFENGSEQTRPRFTRQRGTWVLHWPAISDTDYQVLINFYKQTHGGSESFSWKHPWTNVIYTVRITAKQPFKLVSPMTWSGQVTLKEV